MNEPTHLDLFSGIGGFALAAHWAGFRTVALAELDDEAALMLASHFPGVPNLRDVRQVGLHSTLGRIDLLTGGVPCQPASLLGKRLGSADERWLWPDTIRILGELRPRFAVFENPPALLSLESGRAFAGILGQMAALRYDVLWGIIPAAAVGAGHLRERVCIIAADSLGGCERLESKHELCAGWNGTGSKDQDRTPADAQGVGRRDEDIRHDAGRQSREARETPAGGMQHEAFANAFDPPASGRSGLQEKHSESDVPSDGTSSAHSDNPRLQRQPWHGNVRGNWSSRTRPVAAGDLRKPTPPTDPESEQTRSAGQSRKNGDVAASFLDLRGRQSSEHWWHEANTGVPVLAHGIPARLAEAAARCTGNAIVPQAFYPILKALRALIS